MALCLLLIFNIIFVMGIFLVKKDILLPAFVFSAVFVVAEFNLLTNIFALGTSISVSTALIIAIGIISFTLGNFVVSNKKFILKKFLGFENRVLYLDKFKLSVLMIFNVFSIFYILREVYQMTVEKGGYSGSIVESLGIYAELAKFSNINMKISTMSTLFTALCEAESFAFGFIISRKIVYKEKIDLMEFLCFVTSFLVSFCQGSRGGIWILLSSCISYIQLYKEKNGANSFNFRMLIKIFVIIILSILVFQLSGVVTGKFWDVSFYEYLSVYLGYPILNLDIALKNGIKRSYFAGSITFGPIIRYFFSRLGLSVPSYKGLSEFQYINGKNLGNVYTIFAYLIADFSIIGMTIVLFILGIVSACLYNYSKNSKSVISTSKILYAYTLTNIGFSFFSNKFCENISIYHGAVFFFVYLFGKFLTKKIK